MAEKRVDDGTTDGRTDEHRSTVVDRRTFLGTVGVGTAIGLAGCAGGGDGGGDGGGPTPTATATETTTDRDGGDGGDGGDSGPVKVGVLLPFTGEYSWVGANVMPVAEMIARTVNENGGIGSRDLTLVQGDTEATVDASVSAIRNLINVENVRGIIGPTSLTFTGVIDVIQENQVPVVSPTAGTTELNDVGGEYIFRTVPSDTLGGRALAKAAREESYNGVRSYERMALMVGEAPALQSFKAPIRDSFEEFGGTVTTVTDFATGKASYDAEVSSVIDSNPEIVAAIASPEDTAKILRAAFNAGYEGNWFFTQDQTNTEFLADTDDRLTDGTLGLQEAPNPDAVEAGRIEQFNREVVDFSGNEPGLFATNTYDAVNVLGAAMTATATGGDRVTGANVAPNVPAVANPPGTAVTDYPETNSEIESGNDVDYSGLVGPVDFDENGDITSPFSIRRAEGDEWQETAILPAEEL